MTSALPPFVQAVSGALGSAASNAACYPLELAATKLQIVRSSKQRGLSAVYQLVAQLQNTEGLVGLYSGMHTDTASTIVSKRIPSNDSLLQTIKHALASSTRPVLLGPPTELTIGFVAGVASRAISTPLSVITVRLQTDEDDEHNTTRISKGKRPNFTQLVGRIYAEEGLSGFWAGFYPTLPLCISPALTFLLIQLISRLRPPNKSSDPSRQSELGAFLSGATANALATLILYPLLLAKVRVQAARTNLGRTPSMVDVWTAAVGREGWRGLYAALGAQILKGFVKQGVTMVLKQRIERTVLRLYAK